jgi:hypothetical protein
MNSLFLATLHWRPTLNGAVTGFLVLLTAGWVFWTYLRLARLHTHSRALRLLAPKAAVFALLIFALFDPAWGLTESKSERVRMLALLDSSSSMAVADADAGSRQKRAEELLEKIKSELDTDVDVHLVSFDTEVRETPQEAKSDTILGTDLGRCLVTTADRPDIAAFTGVILLTDGGDEHVNVAQLPRAPLYILGMGTSPADWNDIMLEDVDAPATVEQQVEFSLNADLRAYDNGGFSDGLGTIKVHLEVKDDDEWVAIDVQNADLSSRRARINFTVPGSKELGLVRYRIRAEAIKGELTDLNNVREFNINIEKKSLTVLMLTRSLGWDVNAVRKVLDRDPGVSLTALTRLTGERYLVQGDRQENDKAIEQGFPTDADVLDLYRCLIIGSLPAESWTPAQFDALKTYVQRGGAVVFLGGDASFGLGGYAETPLAPLFPWSIGASEAELLPGEFPVGLPPATGEQDLLTGFAEAMKGASLPLASINQPGPLRTGAISLLDSSVNSRNVAVIALQPYGQGQVLGVGTNTMWRWAKANDAGKVAYQVFWRQMIRHLADVGDSGRFVTLQWDRRRYRAGEQAEIKIRVAGRYSPGELRLDAHVKRGEEVTPLRLDPVADRPGSYSTALFFPERGDYKMTLNIHAGDRQLEEFTKVIRIEPTVNEGAALPVDHAFLEELANESLGSYASEENAEDLIATIKGKIVHETVSMDIPLVEEYGIFITLLLLLLITEWVLRRKMNLI